MIQEHNLSIALQGIQSVCVGLFKPNYSPKWELVIQAEPFTEDEYEGYLIKSLDIGDLFGMSTTHTSTRGGKYVPFPEDKTLSQMMQDPIEFNNWYKLNIGL